MSLDAIKNAIHHGINELFAVASVDELAGDAPAYKEKLETIAKIAEALGIETEITSVTISAK